MGGRGSGSLLPDSYLSYYSGLIKSQCAIEVIGDLV